MRRSRAAEIRWETRKNGAQRENGSAPRGKVPPTLPAGPSAGPGPSRQERPGRGSARGGGRDPSELRWILGGRMGIAFLKPAPLIGKSLAPGAFSSFNCIYRNRTTRAGSTRAKGSAGRIKKPNPGSHPRPRARAGGSAPGQGWAAGPPPAPPGAFPRAGAYLGPRQYGPHIHTHSLISYFFIC